MPSTTRISHSRPAFTLIELLVVVAIMLAIAALAAAFAPRVSDNQNLSRAVDNLEQWLLTAKMRAKRDGLATGVRFVLAPGDSAPAYSQVQYIQQPDPISGYPGLSTVVSVGVGTGTLTLSGVDFTVPGIVQPGDYLEVRDGGVYLIGSVNAAASSVGLSGTAYDSSLSITIPTSNFRILRQPRILIGEEPLTLPNNFAAVTPYSGAAINLGPSLIAPEILFSPTGAVVGTNAGQGALFMAVYDQTMNPFDINKVGIVAVQCRTGFVGAYSVAPGADPFAFAESGRESGL